MDKPQLPPGEYGPGGGGDGGARLEAGEVFRLELVDKRAGGSFSLATVAL